MTKSTEKTAEMIEFPTFDATKATDQFRAFAEKGVEQSKEAYAKMKSGAEEAQKTMESTFETARAAQSDLSKKSIAAMRANTEAGFNHLEAMAGVKSISEFAELQTAFMRKNFEMAMEQMKDFQSASTKAADDVSKPAKSAFDKAMKDMKVA